MHSDNTSARNQVPREAARGASPAPPRSRAALIVTGASLLALGGIALQAVEFAYGPMLRENCWALSVAVHGLWNMLTPLLEQLAAPEALRFGPLLLVLAGCGILLVMRQPENVPTARDLRRRETSRG